jgi:hypothetical protein
MKIEKSGIYNNFMMVKIEEQGLKNSAAAQAVELFNHALRLEYPGIMHLPRLDDAVQDVHIHYCISLLINDSIAHAIRLAAFIRELGGVPAWTVWTPPDSGNLARVFEVQLTRERICRLLYEKAAQILSGIPLAKSCTALAQDENRHIDRVGHVLRVLSEGTGPEPLYAGMPVC